MIFSPQKQKFVDSATEMFGVGTVINKQQVIAASANAGVPKAGWFKKQFKVGYRFVTRHPVWTIDYDNKIFFWHRPPYANDPIWKDHEIIGKIPANPLQNTENNLYFDCFSATPIDPHKARSKHQN